MHQGNHSIVFTTIALFYIFLRFLRKNRFYLVSLEALFMISQSDMADGCLDHDIHANANYGKKTKSITVSICSLNTVTLSLWFGVK